MLNPSIRRILLIVLITFILLEFTALPSGAEVSEKEGFIKLPLQVDVDDRGKKRWIMLPPADRSQIQLDDDEARTIIFEAVIEVLTGIASPEAQKKKRWSFKQWVKAVSGRLKSITKDKNLEMSVTEDDTSPFDNVAESIGIGAKDILVLPIEVALKGIPLESLNLVLMIGNRDGQFQSKRLGVLSDLSTDEITETMKEKTVLTVRDSIGLTEVEIDNLKDELFRIAVQTLKHAKAEPYEMAFGAVPPAFSRADPDLNNLFRFPGSQIITLHMKESKSSGFSHELTLGPLKVVRKIQIQHTNESYVYKANKLLDKLQKTLPRVWDSAFYKVLKDRLHDDKRVWSLGKTSIENGIYLIIPDLGGPLFEGGAKVSAGFTYSSDKKLAGTASATVSNLSGRNEQTSIRAEMGEEIQKANFRFSLPQPAYRSYNDRLKDSTFHLIAGYERDKEQLYENVEADQELVKTGIAYSFEWDSLEGEQQGRWGKDPKPDHIKSRFITTAKLALDYENWHFRGQDPATPLLNDGKYGIAKLNVGEDMSFDFRHWDSRFRELNLPVWFEGQYGYGFDDEDDDYSQLRFGIQSKFYFRWRDENDISFNLSYHGGISGNKTPVFKKFKIGASDTIRGLESGEILANSYSLQSIEMGISLWAFLMPLFDDIDKSSDNTQLTNENSDKVPKKKTDQEIKEEKERENLIKTLKNVRLEIFYDRGSVSQEDRFSDMFNFGGDLEGYGINFSIRFPDKNFELEIGYAFSPDSETQSSGLFYTRIDKYLW